MNKNNRPSQRGNSDAGTSHDTSSGFSPDLTTSHHGSLVLFHPRTEHARAWLDEHCAAGPEHIYFGAALVVEPRYANELLAHAMEDGLNTSQP